MTSGVTPVSGDFRLRKSEDGVIGKEEDEEEEEEGVLLLFLLCLRFCTRICCSVCLISVCCCGCCCCLPCKRAVPAPIFAVNALNKLRGSRKSLVLQVLLFSTLPVLLMLLLLLMMRESVAEGFVHVSSRKTATTVSITGRWE